MRAGDPIVRRTSGRTPVEQDLFLTRDLRFTTAILGEGTGGPLAGPWTVSCLWDGPFREATGYF